VRSSRRTVCGALRRIAAPSDGSIVPENGSIVSENGSILSENRSIVPENRSPRPPTDPGVAEDDAGDRAHRCEGVFDELNVS